MQPCNLIIVNDFAHINGGAAKVALLSALGLAERGHNVVVFSAVEPVMAELRKGRINLVCTNQHQILTDPNRFRAARQGLWNTAAARRMARLLDSCDPTSTIVHLHGWTKSLSASVIHEAAKRNFPIVCTLHEYFIACPNGGFFNYPKNQICPLRAMSPACIMTNCDKYGYSYKLWRVGRQGIQKVWGEAPSAIGHFITISTFSRDILRPYIGPKAIFHSIPNPILAVKESPVDIAGNKSFIAVGRLTPEKGAFLFAEAARTAGAVPVYVGDGECRHELENRFPEAAIKGWQSENDVKVYLQKARALVLPSLWYETQGLVVLEAAAMGVPAIVPDSCAAREAVIDGETGLWFKGGDASDLARKIITLQDSDTAARMGRAAYDKFWADPPTMDRHLTRLENAYALILENPMPGLSSI